MINMYGKIFCRLFYFINGQELGKEDNIKAKNFAVCVVSITAKYWKSNSATISPLV